MDVTVVCFGAMRDHLPEGAQGNRAELEVSRGATVGDVVDVLGAPRALAFAVLLDGTQASLDAPVSEGSEVTLMPPFAGGSPDLEVGTEAVAGALEKHMGVGPDIRVLSPDGAVPLR